MTRFTVFGIGEAGSLIAADLAAAGAQVAAFDPADVATPAGVLRTEDPRQAVTNTDAVLSITAAADCHAALDQAISHIPSTAIYADFATTAASLKEELAGKARKNGVSFVDVALMSVVVGKGINANVMAAGSGVTRFGELMSPFGMPVTIVEGDAGEATKRKLLRSVFMKGLAAVMIEALRGAEAAGLSDWLWDNLSEEIAQADEQLLRRLVAGTAPHAERRLHEMQAAADQLLDLGVDPLMTRSTVGNLQLVLRDGLPPIPGSD